METSQPIVSDRTSVALGDAGAPVPCTPPMGPDEFADFEERTFCQWDPASLGDLRRAIKHGYSPATTSQQNGVLAQRGQRGGAKPRQRPNYKPSAVVGITAFVDSLRRK